MAKVISIKNVKVTPRKMGKARVLVIASRNGALKIKRTYRPTLIRWSLAKKVSGGLNTQDNGYSPGFAWIGSTPNEGQFASPTLSPDAQVLSMLDDHVRDETIGTWFYRLSATINGEIYLLAHQGTTMAAPDEPPPPEDSEPDSPPPDPPPPSTPPPKVSPEGTSNPSIKNR